MNKGVIIVMVGLLLVVALVYIQNSYPSDGKEDVYIHTAFNGACLKLATKYTPEQFEAWNDLNQKIYGYKLQRCD